MKNTFGANLRKAREFNGWTQEMAAKKINIKRSAYGAWEEGRGCPAFPALVRIVQVFRITDLVGFLENEQFDIKQQLPAVIKPANIEPITNLEKQYAAAGIRERLAVNILLGLVDIN